MNRLQIVSVAALLVVSASATAQRNKPAEDCFSVGSQADARECLTKRFGISEAELKKSENAVLRLIKAWDESPSARDRSTKTFKASSIQFRHYRTAQCEMQASFAAGGTGTGHRRLLCAIDLNERRLADLQTTNLPSR